MQFKTLRAPRLAGTLALSAFGPAAAQDLLKGPVKIIIPFPPGGATDIIASEMKRWSRVVTEARIEQE